MSMLLIWNVSDGSYFELDSEAQLVEVPDDVDFDEIISDYAHDFPWLPLKDALQEAELTDGDKLV